MFEQRYARSWPGRQGEPMAPGGSGRDVTHSHTLRVVIPWVAAVLCVVLTASPAMATAGSRLWAERYNGPGDGIDSADAIAVSPDGSKVFVTGGSWGGVTTANDYATLAYDSSTGKTLWLRRYNDANNANDVSAALGVGPRGSRVFVTGVGGLGFRTLAYDSFTGKTLWLKRYNGQRRGDTGATALAVSPSGSKVFVTGYSYGGPMTGYDYATVAYRASTGRQLWSKRYDGSGNVSPTAIGVSPDGSRVYVTGWITVNNSYDYATVAYGATNGARLWVKRYPGFAKALSVSPHGSKVLVTGQGGTVAYDASTGATLWTEPSSGYGVRVSYDGSEVFVAGGGSIEAYDASTGATLWTGSFNGSASALGVSPHNSKVYVSGGSSGGSTTGVDYLTVAYDASTGTKLWARSYNSPSSLGDAAHALGVRPSGSEIFVTGDSAGNFATLAYSTR